jgi:hypothetical protein
LPVNYQTSLVLVESSSLKVGNVFAKLVAGVLSAYFQVLAKTNDVVTVKRVSEVLNCPLFFRFPVIAGQHVCALNSLASP